MRIALLFVPLCLFAQTADEVQKWVSRPVLDPKQAQVEAQVYTGSRIPPVPSFSNAVQWQRYATQLRGDVLDQVVLRGEAKRWRSADRKVEWLETIEAQGYRLKKLRYEAIPGLWIPALLYEPQQLSGKVPVVLNVNGHEGKGVATDYIQQRCINLARRGMLAFNAEFLGKGQLHPDELNHYRMPMIDLTGTSGLATFYLSLERNIDIALMHPNADPARVAVTGLSGGGWQTTIISGLDARVTAVVPVAGHSSFVTRSQWPDLDLGDSEQTPSDLATLADYLHLSAMVAPKPLMFINNEKDNCCFRADYAMAPLVQAARQVYALHGALDKLRYYINHSNGHNYDQASREELYKFLRDSFFGGRADFPVDELPAEVRTPEQLHVPLPANASFRSIATKLAEGLPRGSDFSRAKLGSVVRPQSFGVEAKEMGREAAANVSVNHWRLRMGRTWNVPVTEIEPRGARETVLVIADSGRAQTASQIAALVAQGKRVAAFDPMGFGEAKMGRRDFLFQMQIASFGERPLGVQAGQVIAAAEWLKQRFNRAPALEAFGRRTSLIGLVAAALGDQAIASVTLHQSMRSLKQILELDLTVDKQPEMFCFGLLESFDISQMAALVAPRPVRME